MTWTLLDGTVQRANLDGSGIETLLTGSDSPWDITFGTPGTSPVPAVSTWGLLALAGLLGVAGVLVIGRRVSRA
jgi:hypothetical protein